MSTSPYRFLQLRTLLAVARTLAYSPFPSLYPRHFSHPPLLLSFCCPMFQACFSLLRIYRVSASGYRPEEREIQDAVQCPESNLALLHVSPIQRGVVPVYDSEDLVMWRREWAISGDPKISIHLLPSIARAPARLSKRHTHTSI